MTRFVLGLVFVLGHALLARGHELPDGEIERRVQVVVKPDRVLVEYSLAMNEATLENELLRCEQRPAETLASMWEQYQEIVLPSLPENMHLTIDGECSPLKPIRADYSGRSHVQLTCLLRSDILLTEQPKKIIVTDGNFLDSPGDYRIAMKGRSGAKMVEPTVPPLVTRAKPVVLSKLTKQQKQAAARAEGQFNVAASSNVAAGALFPDELVHFVPAQENPVFAGAGTDTWDRKVRERGYILRHGGKWHLWYTGYSGERTATKMLGYATSPDGMTWKRHPGNPVFDESWTEDVHVVRHGETFYMVAEGRGDIPHLLTSQDGIDWKDHGRLDVRRRDGSPLSPGPYGTPTLWIECDAWYLFYERGDLGVWLAKSTDRQTWTNVEDAPVIARGPAEYDRHAVALNQVVRYRGRYYGVYHANADSNRKGPWTTCLAVSDDLVKWKKYTGNPIIRTNNSSGQLVHDGERYLLYTMHPDVRVHLPRVANSGD